jgi:hypothetical protein
MDGRWYTSVLVVIQVCWRSGRAMDGQGSGRAAVAWEGGKAGMDAYEKTRFTRDCDETCFCVFVTI